MKAENPKLLLREIAEQLPEKPSWDVVRDALALHARMLAMNLTSPYTLVLEPPADYPKLRKHKHPRYHFEPRHGYERPNLM